MPETIISHVSSAEHPAATPLEGVMAVDYEAITKIGAVADGERTPESDVIAILGTVLFRNLVALNTFLQNPKQDLVVVGIARGQLTSSTFTFVNCRAQRQAGRVRMGSASESEAQGGVEFQADSLTGPTTPV